jgi:hypothetical protein
VVAVVCPADPEGELPHPAAINAAVATNATRTCRAPSRPHRLPASMACDGSSRPGNDYGGDHVAIAVQALTLPFRVRAPRSAEHSSAVVTAAKVLAVAGAAAYNWWVVVPFVPGLLPSINGFFSDLEVSGRPHAAQMSDADLAAGVLMLAALLLRGSVSDNKPRREWKWLVVFAVAGAVGGRYSYACSEGLSATCRAMEWHLQLPVHHYVHIASGIVEFAALTTAAVIAMRRTRGDGTSQARFYAAVVKVLAVSYPLLGVVYLTDRLGILVEPIFFITFSAVLLAEVFEPTRRKANGPAWAERAADQGAPGVTASARSSR